MKIKGKRINVEIPTASQSDIAFLLIIFFLVTASFATKSGISLLFPKKDSLPKEVYKKEIGNIKITLQNIYIGEKAVEERLIEKVLEEFNYKHIIVTIEKGVKYGKVAKILGYLQEKNAEISLRVEQ